MITTEFLKTLLVNFGVFLSIALLMLYKKYIWDSIVWESNINKLLKKPVFQRIEKLKRTTRIQIIKDVNLRCYICLNNFKLNQRAIVCNNCPYMTHRKHYLIWYKRKKQCPVCKVNL